MHRLSVCLSFVPLLTACALPLRAVESAGADVAVAAPMVVTVTRGELLLQDAPSAVSLRTADNLRLDNPVRVLTDAFRDEPGVMVQKTGHAQGSPYMRGFTGYRNLFAIDGVRLNNSVFRDGPNQYWNTVDALSLSRIEIARGTLSMLYGSDAVGGTVNAVTRGAADLRAGSDWDRRLYYRYADAERAHILRAESIGRLTAELALTLGYTYKIFGDLDGGRRVGRQPRTGYDERFWDVKLEYQPAANAMLTLVHQDAATDDTWRTHRTIYGIDWEGLSRGDELQRSLDQERRLTGLQLRLRDLDGAIEDIHAGISLQRQQENQFRLRTRERRDEQGFDVETLGAFVTLKSPIKSAVAGYGLEYYRDTVDSFNHTLDAAGMVTQSAIQGPVGDGATYDLFGAWLQIELPLTSRLMLIPGTRFEFAKASADRVEDPVTGEPITAGGEWNDMVSGLRLLYALDAGGSWNLFAGVAQGFRAPNISDLTRFDSARTSEIETPTPGIGPERFVSTEAGIRAETAALSAQLALFYTRINGMIVRTLTGRMIGDEFEVTRKNAGDGFIHGIELNARALLPCRFTVFGAFTWMDGEVDNYPSPGAPLVSEPVDRLMPPTGHLGLRHHLHDRFWIEGVCRMAAKADRLSSGDKADTSRIPPGGTPGYTVYDIRANWQCAGNLRLSAAVENITDEDYRIHGSGVNEPGRNLVLAAELVF